jgi:hypothetical protein
MAAIPQPSAVLIDILRDQIVTRRWSSQLRLARRMIVSLQCNVVVDIPGFLVAVLFTGPARRARRRPGCSSGPLEPLYRYPSSARPGLLRSVMLAVSTILRFTIQIIGGITLKREAVSSRLSHHPNPE